jgi:hypothetical protein
MRSASRLIFAFCAGVTRIPNHSVAFSAMINESL